MAASHSYSQVVPFPVDEVFGWYARPGALVRLTPPWLPIRPVQEATSLRDGTAVLALPGGLRWVARHRPDGYRHAERFVDELASPALHWGHEHDFHPVESHATRVFDRVTTAVPARLLDPVFAYRHRQLLDDLTAHRQLRDQPDAPLRVAVTGSSGLIGTALCAFLSTGGHQVTRLVRRSAATPDERSWHPDNPDPDLLRGVDAVVHLAGTSIAGRFTEAHLRAVRDSRVTPTRRLAELIGRTADGPRVFVTASAIGYYGADRGDELLSETADRGEGVLADLVADWEAAAEPAAVAGARVTAIRTGIVQSPRGGVLRLLRPLFAAGLGGPVGNGQQWVSWIGVDDLLDVYLRALVDPRLAGPVNAVAPDPVRFDEYAATLGHVLHRPSVLRVPALGPQLLLGKEGARELALASQRVRPERLLTSGHQFRRPRLVDTLAHLLGKLADSASADRDGPAGETAG
jgi:uncharacterized protein (TIGR01777 family)